MHRRIAVRLLEDPRVLEAARWRVEEWNRTGSVASHYAIAWRRLLRQSQEEIARLIANGGEEARALRQVTPFAGVVPPRERWRI